MSQPSFDFEQWQLDYEAASTRQAYDLVLALLEQPLPPEAMEEYDLGMTLVEMRDELANSNDFDAIFRFFGTLRDRHPDLYASEYPYFDDFLIDYYLYQDNIARVEAALGNFRANPVLGIDQLFGVLASLSFYGQNDLARELCNDVYDPVRRSSEVIRGVEDELKQIPFYDRVERIYRAHQQGETLDWQHLKTELQALGLVKKPRIFTDLRRDLTEPLPPPDALTAEFQDDLAKFLRRLVTATCCQLWNQKQMSFLATKALWDTLIEFLERRDVPPAKLRSPNAFFAFSEDELDRYLGQLMGALLSDRSTTAVGFLWGLPYLYDSLREFGVIEAATHTEAIAAVAHLKPIVCDFYKRNLWRFDFVHRWQPADSLDLAAHEAEAEQFRASFERTYPLSEEPAAERDERQLRQMVEALGAAEEAIAEVPGGLDSPELVLPPIVPDPPPPTSYQVPKKKKSPLKLAAELGKKKKNKT